eukprot:gene6353-6586_t
MGVAASTHDKPSGVGAAFKSKAPDKAIATLLGEDDVGQLQEGADAWAIDRLGGRTALHYAVRSDCPELVQLLLEATLEQGPVEYPNRNNTSLAQLAGAALRNHLLQQLAEMKQLHRAAASDGLVPPSHTTEAPGRAQNLILQIRIHGLRLEVQQRQTPEATSQDGFVVNIRTLSLSQSSVSSGSGCTPAGQQLEELAATIGKHTCGVAERAHFPLLQGGQAGAGRGHSGQQLAQNLDAIPSLSAEGEAARTEPTLALSLHYHAAGIGKGGDGGAAYQTTKGSSTHNSSSNTTRSNKMDRAAEAQQALKAAESTMTVCEVATHRVFVALLHSRHLRRTPALRQIWFEALDGLGGFVDLIPGRTWDHSSRREQGFAAYMHCPTVAVRLTSDQQPHQPQLAAELKGLAMQLSSSRQAVLEVQQWTPSAGPVWGGGFAGVGAVELGPILFQLRPQLALTALAYLKSVEASNAAAEDAAEASAGRLVPLKQMVLDSYKRNRVALSFALSALLPVLDVSCPQLALVAPLRDVRQLSSSASVASTTSARTQHRGSGGWDQQPPDSAVELVARMSQLHASVGYNSSCYSSLLQQVDATANMELMFIQCAATPTAAQQQLAQYAAIWMHPDDVQQLMAAGQLLPDAVGRVAQQQATGAAAQPLRGVRQSFAAAAPASPPSLPAALNSSSFNAWSWGGPAPAESTAHPLPLVPVTQPFAPLGRLQQLWARLTTHIPTEPAVTGGEHTTVGLSAAGALLFVSPWQVTAALVEAVAPLHAAGAVAVQQRALNPAAAGASTETVDHGGLQSQPQQVEFNAAALQASRTAAKQSSLSVLVSLPYLEVLCYADIGVSGVAVGLDACPRHRYPIQPSMLVKMSGPQLRRQHPLLQQWSQRIAPVVSFVLSDLKAGTSTDLDGLLAARVHMSSLLLVNLQLLDLCKIPATMPSAAGIYLPDGHIVPDCTPPRSSAGLGLSAAAAAHLAAQSGGGGVAVSAANAPGASLSANYNAFVLSPYTARLTTAYQMATLSRWQLCGLSRLTSTSTSRGSSSTNLNVLQEMLGSGAMKDQLLVNRIQRGTISRRLLVRRRWQRVLDLRAFARTLDYAMFLLFCQDNLRQWTDASSDQPSGAERQTAAGAAAAALLGADRVSVNGIFPASAVAARQLSSGGSAGMLQPQSKPSKGIHSNGPSPAACASASPAGGMHIFHVLKSLRAGSASILQSAAQQLKLRQAQQRSSSSPGTKQDRPSLLSSMSRYDEGRHGSQLPSRQLRQDRSGRATKQPQQSTPTEHLMNQPDAADGWHVHQQQLQFAVPCHTVVDFLDRFVPESYTGAWGGKAAGDWSLASAHLQDTPRSYQSSGSSQQGMIGVQQPQLSVAYTQQPAVSGVERSGSSSSMPARDLCACVEHRHALSGSSAPLQAQPGALQPQLSRSPAHSACYLAARALFPSAQGQPMQLAVSVHNPRLVVVILPRSHACKTLSNKYSKVTDIRRAAQLRCKTASDSDELHANRSADEGSSSDGLDASEALNVMPSRRRTSHSSAAGGQDGRQRQQGLLHMTSRGGSGTDAAAQVQEPLHSYYTEVVLLQVAQVTVAAPAAPDLLVQAHSNLQFEACTGCQLPVWMQRGSAVQQLLASSVGNVAQSTAWSKVAPKRRKLVIRPGGAADCTVAGPSVATAATARSGSAGLQGPGRPAAAKGAAAAGGKGPAWVGATGDAVAAYCLVDLTNVEVLSGRMSRVKAAAWRGFESRPEVMRREANLAPPGSWSLTDLSPLILRTRLQAALHEYNPDLATAAGYKQCQDQQQHLHHQQQPQAMKQAAPATVLAVAAPDALALQMSDQSYRCFLDMLFGNIMHNDSSFEGVHLVEQNCRAFNTAFNPGVKFGPQPGRQPTFAVTLSSSAAQGPFDVHVDVWAANTEWLDLRMSSSKAAAQKLKQLRRTTGDDALHPGTEVSREDVAEKVAADRAAGLRLSTEGGEAGTDRLLTPFAATARDLMPVLEEVATPATAGPGISRHGEFLLRLPTTASPANLNSRGQQQQQLEASFEEESVQVALAHALLQWPYLTDMSLVSAIIHTFNADWGGPPKPPPAWLQLKRLPWLYFNLVITDSQIFVPLLTPHLSTLAASHQQHNEQHMPSHHPQQQQEGGAASPFELLWDVVLQQAAGLTATDIYQGKGLQLEQLGLALTFGAFRFGYFFGGDGEAVTRIDVRNIAGFIRDRAALITNWLLPLPSATLELRQDFPLVEEHKGLKPILLALRKLLFQYRVRARLRKKREEAAGMSSPEQRLLALACEHAEELFGEKVTADWHNTWLQPGHSYDRGSQANSAAMFAQSSSGMFGVYKHKARSELLVTVAPVTLRAAFSNLPTWKTLQSDLQLASQSMGAGLGMWPPRPDLQSKVLEIRAAGGTWPPPPTGWAAAFRRSSMRCNADLAAVVLMLCDDKPQSFGAPDVLQAVARGVSLVHAHESRFPRVAPEMADRLHIEGGLGLNILNNSSSKWEVLLEPWPLLVSLSNPINPLAKADRTLFAQMLSGDPLRINFFPSSLLSIGDLLAFCKEVSVTPAESCSSRQQQPQQGSLELMPAMYLIQNLTGSHLWYWAPDDPSAGCGCSRNLSKRVYLAAHSMQELKVSPSPRRVRHLAADGSLLSTGMANAISIQMAGSWLPLEDVAVDVVGKYRYEVRDPLGGAALPLLLDVLLVGRTKMLRLHSCLWLQNRSGLRLQPVLQLGSSCRMPVVLGPGDKLDSLQQLHLRPLKPKEGRFLPAAAALGGMLFLAPEGHLPSEHDVLRLTPSLVTLKKQQGYVTCHSKPERLQCGPLHLAATIHLGLQNDPHFTTQNLVEVPRPGTLRRARMPLEAAIRVSPTLQFTNGLPYDVLGWALVPFGKDASLYAHGNKLAGHPPHVPLTTRLGTGTAGTAPAAAGKMPLQKVVAGAGDGGVAVSAAQRVSSTIGSTPQELAQNGTDGRLMGMQQVWGASSKREAAVALAKVVAASGPALQRLAAGSAAANTPAVPVRNRRGSIFGGRGASVIGDLTKFPLAMGNQGHELQHQRWCRDLLLEEFVTTLHLLLSPAVVAAVDVAALWLLDLPALVALVLGVLHEEFFWIAKAFPHVFGLLIKLDEAISKAKGAAPPPAAVSPEEVPSAGVFRADATPAAGAAGSGAAAAARQHLHVQILPWPADQLPIVELLTLLFWLQQHAVRLQLAPGTCADLYLDPDLDVYAAVKVPVLAMQSRPTLISGGLSTQAAGSDSLRLFYSTSLDTEQNTWQLQQSLSGMGRVSRTSFGGGGSGSASAAALRGGLRMGLAALTGLTHAGTVHGEVLVKMTDAARLLADLVGQKKAMQQQQRLQLQLQQQEEEQLPVSLLSLHGTTATAFQSASNTPGAASSSIERLHSHSSAPCELPSIRADAGKAADIQLAEVHARLQPGQSSAAVERPLPAVPLPAAGHVVTLSWFSVVVELLSDIVRLAMYESDCCNYSGQAAGGASRDRVVNSIAAGSAADRSTAGGSALLHGTVVSPLHRFQTGMLEQQVLDLELAEMALAVLGDALYQQATAVSSTPLGDGAAAVTGMVQPGAGAQPPCHRHGHDSGSSAMVYGSRAVTTASGDAAGGVQPAAARVQSNLPVVMADLTAVLLDPPEDVQRVLTELVLAREHVLTGERLLIGGDTCCLVHCLMVLASELVLAGEGLLARLDFGWWAGVLVEGMDDEGVNAQPDLQLHTLLDFASEVLVANVLGPLQEDTAADRASIAGSMCSVVVHDSEDEPEVEYPELPGPSAPPPTPAGQGHSTPAPQKAPSLFQRRQQRAINTPLGDGPAGQERQAGVSPLREALGLSDDYSRQPRVTGGSEESDENSADESTGPLSHSSFRRRPGASVKQLARSVRRAGGAPARLVHHQLSAHLLKALERQLQQLPPEATPAVLPGQHLQGTLVQQGWTLASMHLQALGLGAVAAEVQEGRPGFCAPPALTLTLMHSGGGFGPGGTKPAAGSSTTHQVLMTASYWLDNRSGLNLVLSDLDRRMLKGLPGPGLTRTADVHSPGLPRDCAALESAEPDLAALLNASSSPGPSHSTAATGPDSAAASEQGQPSGAGCNTSIGVFSADAAGLDVASAEEDMEVVLARLQEVRPALLNEQAWLRFWVEEHMVVLAGSTPRHRPRHTFSFNKASPKLTGLISPNEEMHAAANVAAAGSSGGGLRAAQGLGQLKTNQVHVFRSEPSGFFKISSSGAKSDIKVKGNKAMAVVAASARQQARSGFSSSSGARSSRQADDALTMKRDMPCNELDVGSPGSKLADPTVAFVAGDRDGGVVIIYDPAVAVEVPVQRLFEFAAEVWPAPADGPFRATKVVSIKSKYILFNDTGMALHYKQKGTPDIDHPGYLSYGEGRRFAGVLQPQERVAFHWDNVFEPRQLLVRPAAPGWPWSGAFWLPDKEEYFGLRLINRQQVDIAKPTPALVNTWDAVIRSDLSGARAALSAKKHPNTSRPVIARAATPAQWDNLSPGSSLPFAWDEVTARHTVEVVAEVLPPGTKLATGAAGAQGLGPPRGKNKNTYSFDLDTLQAAGNMLGERATTAARVAASSQALAPAATTQHHQQDQQAKRPQHLELKQGKPSATSAMQVLSGMVPFLEPMAGTAGSGSIGGRQSRKSGHDTPVVAAVHHPAASSAGSTLLQGSGIGFGSQTHRAASSSAAAAAAAGAPSLAVFDRKVYVTVYADGPTRVLCFSDEATAGASTEEDEGGSQQLMSRLHQVARNLMSFDRQLALHLGGAYSARVARNMRAVPAVLLMQQQQGTTTYRGPGTALQQLQPSLQNEAVSWLGGSSSTTMAAVAVLQQAGLQQALVATGAGGQQQPQLRWTRSTGSAYDGSSGAPAAAAATMSASAALMEDLEMQGRLAGAGSSVKVEQQTQDAPTSAPGLEAGHAAPATFSGTARVVLPGMLSGSTLASGSHISSKALTGAAAAAGAGVKVSGGLLSADSGPDGGLKLYYDKLTLLLDSGLPLGGNCKVKLLSARGLAGAGSVAAERYVATCAARLVVAGRAPVVSGVAALQQRQQDEEVVWDFEELLAEVGVKCSAEAGLQVTALSELVIEIWGLPSASILSSRRHHSQPHSVREPGAPAAATGVAKPIAARRTERRKERRRRKKRGGANAGAAAGSTLEAAAVGGVAAGAQLPSGSIFLGQVNIPLIQTLPGTATAGRGPGWFGLMRRTGGQHVTGEVQVNFSWSFTLETLLASELSELERLLAARQEMLAMLRPLSCNRVARMMSLTGLGGGVGGAPAAGANPATGNSLASGSSNAAAGAAALVDSSSVSLEVGVVEVANLCPRSGWSQDLTHALLSSASTGNSARPVSSSVMLTEAVKQADLPLPVVYVFCGSTGGAGDSGFEVASGFHTLNPLFATNRYLFQHVGVRSVLRVMLYDRRSGLDSRLLGVAHIPASAIPAGNGGPTYMWVPLLPPDHKKTTRLARIKGYWQGMQGQLPGSGQVTVLGARSASSCQVQPGGSSSLLAPADQRPPLQVKLRVRVVKPPTHNTTASLRVNLAGMLLNAKANGGDELFNLTVDTLQCAVLNTTRQRQLTLSVLSVQLDNQLLATRHPVVLSPATLPEESAGRLEPVLTTDKAVDDMDNPAKAVMAILARTVPQPGGPGGRSCVRNKAGGAEARGATASSAGSVSAVSKAAIVSFKKVELLVGAMDVKTDQLGFTSMRFGLVAELQAFLEAVYSFVQGMPMADLWQDQTWQEHVALLQGNAAADAAAGGAAAALGSAPSGALLPPTATAAAVGRRVTVAAAGPGRSTLGAAGSVLMDVGELNHMQLSHGLGHSAGLSAVASASVWPAGLVPANAGGAPLPPATLNLAGQPAGCSEQQLQLAPRPSAAAVLSPANKAARRAAAAQRAALDSALVLAWLPAKHDTELSNMKGQSSTWFFFEQLYISTVAVNVTIMLTSSFGTEVQRLVVRGMFSGQLINVSDVGLTLGSLDLQNRLLNQVGLRSVLIRHYTWRCVAQARKVLGGAGPGVAQIPTSILWAGASVFDMVREMVDGTLPLPMILPALLHVAFTFASQMLGITSRLAMALLELVPVDRRGALSDRAALQRYVQMPETVVEAFYQAVMELYWGTASGFAGLLLDPAAGLRQPGALGVAGAIVGLIKGGAGLLLRPVFGAVDATSKSLRGVGLVFLGRRGWHGKVVRRVRPPGALEGPAAASAAPGSGFARGSWQAERDLHLALIASWQARLPGLHPRLVGDEVMEVLATRSRRLLLLTRQHVLYLRAKVATRGADAGSCTYTLRWLLECERVDHVRGMEDALKIFLEFHMLLKAPDFSNWRLRRVFRSCVLDDR